MAQRGQTREQRRPRRVATPHRDRLGCGTSGASSMLHRSSSRSITCAITLLKKKKKKKKNQKQFVQLIIFSWCYWILSDTLPAHLYLYIPCCGQKLSRNAALTKKKNIISFSEKNMGKRKVLYMAFIALFTHSDLAGLVTISTSRTQQKFLDCV